MSSHTTTTGTTQTINLSQQTQDIMKNLAGGLMGQLNPVAAAGQALGGIAQVAGSLIGGGARRR